MKSGIAAFIAFAVMLGLIVTVVSSRKGETLPKIGPAPNTPGTSGPRLSPGLDQPASTGTPPASGAAAAGSPDSLSLTIVGTLEGEKSTIAGRVPAKVLSVAGEVGTRVSKGQVVVILDDQDLQRQAAQARESTVAAQAALEKAKKGRPLKEGEIDAKIGEAQQGVEQARLQLDKAKTGATAAAAVGKGEVDRAQAGVTRAEAGLRAAMRGARPEEIRKAELAVEAGRKGVETARKYLEKMKGLVRERAVPQVREDQAQSDYDKALAQFQQAEQTLSQAKAGPTREEIDQARAGVEEAKAGLESAKTGARTRTEAAQKDVAAAQLQLENAERGVLLAQEGRRQLDLLDEDIRAAQAQLTSANLQAQQATEQLQNTRLTSPLGGVISAVNVTVGEIASPGRPLISVVSTARLHMDASVPSRLVSTFAPGTSVEVEVDGQTRKFAGIVREVASVANPDSRSFPARIELYNLPTEALRAGGARPREAVVTEPARERRR